MSTQNPICFDCGRKLTWDSAVAVPYDSRTIYLCSRCYRAPVVSLDGKRNPQHKCPSCGTSIYSIGVPRFCPKCKKTWREKNPKKVYRTVKTFPSKSDPSKTYTVKQDEEGKLSCSCPQWIFKRGGVRSCAHIRIVMTEYRHLLKNPLTKKEKDEIKGWANVQYAISQRYQDDPARSAFWKGRAVGMGKVVKAYNPRDRKIRIISPYKRRNPRSMTEKVGNLIGGMGILAILVGFGFILWVQSRKK